MKSRIKYALLILFGLLIGITGYAQSQPSDRLPLADKASFKGKRELRKEKKIKHRMSKHNRHLERKAIKASKASKYTVGKARKARPRRNKNKEQKTIITEPKEKAK